MWLANKDTNRFLGDRDPGCDYVIELSTGGDIALSDYFRMITSNQGVPSNVTCPTSTGGSVRYGGGSPFLNPLIAA